MSFPSHHDPRAIRPLHVVMIALTAIVVGGGFMLLSAAESPALVDGAVAWMENSPLRAVVQLLCMNYQFPTIYAGDVKGTLLGMGAGLGMLALALALLVRNPAEGEEPNGQNGRGGGDALGDRQLARQRGHLSPLIAAQIAIGLYLLWSFASTRWSDAAELALGGSVLIAISFLWSFALGHGLSPAAARMAARLVMVATAVAAVVAIWYFYGRNWTIRAKFPFGNPNFLAVCLIPGMLLGVGLLMEKLTAVSHESAARRAAGIVGALVTLGAAGWAFTLADSRGPLIGLGAGLIVMIFFALRGWWKLLPVVVGIGLTLSAGLYLYPRQFAAQAGGRDATLRFRAYAWNYAVRLAREKPLTGHGQAGYVRKADRFAADQVESDPLVLSARVDHAHNEWLEVLADLGAVGLALVGGGLLLTFLAGGVALHPMLPPDRRWTLIGLLGALAAIAVSEFFGVGLRTAEVPVAFYTVLGLSWALSGGASTNLVTRIGQRRAGRLAVGGLLGAAGIIALVLTQQDFRAARRAYEVDAAIASGDYEEALAGALQATNQLNPQRALTNLYRLAEARMQISRNLLSRAADREARARASEMPDRALQQLAAADRAESELQAAEANRVLKELVTRSPGFINHGYVEFILNLIAADHATAKGDRQLHALATQNAARAIEREMRRQPFDAHIARDYVRAAHAQGSVPALLAALARPLRHNGVSAEDVTVLTPLAQRPEFETHLRGLLAGAAGAGETGEKAEAAGKWRPEELRLAAAYWFAMGQYEDASGALSAATKLYTQMGDGPLIGAASAFAELADVQFFAHPDDAALSLARAESALARLPDSRPGRELRDAIVHRRVDYLLAADREAEARAALTQMATGAVTEEQLSVEMADRYRRLADAILRSRLAGGSMEMAPQLISLVQGWLARAVALDEGSAGVRLTMANAQFVAGDDAGAATALMAALERGLQPETAQRFVEVAGERGRDVKAYAGVTEMLRAMSPAPPAP